MHRQLNYYILSILILLTFTSTSVHSDTCGYNQRMCYRSGYYWCCPSSSSCSSELGYCYTTNISPALISVIIIVPMIICCALVSCCIRAQRRQRVLLYTTNIQTVPSGYQQPSQPVHVGPVYNVGAAPTIHSSYEAPPPYGYSTNNYAPKYS